MEIKIHQATERDAEALFMLNEAFNGADCTSLACLENALASNNHEIVFLAKADGLPVGFCCAQLLVSMCYQDPHAEITELFVQEEFRGKGIATKLVRAAELDCEARGAKEISLLTGEHNHAARAFYEAIGYGREDEVLYRKGGGQ